MRWPVDPAIQYAAVCRADHAGTFAKAWLRTAHEKGEQKPPFKSHFVE
jgi:hypothetical protein